MFLLCFFFFFFFFFLFLCFFFFFFFFQAEDGIRDLTVTGVQTCALPISARSRLAPIPGASRWRASPTTPASRAASRSPPMPCPSWSRAATSWSDRKSVV